MKLNSPHICALLVLASSTLAVGQTKEFEVASIKPHKASDDGRMSIEVTPGGRWRATNISLTMVLSLAYELKPGQLIGAPSWMNAERYDIEAKMDASLGDNPKPGEMLPYVQSLLDKRFQLKFHRESREMPVYALVVAKGGPKMKEADAEERGPMIRMGRGLFTVGKIDMDMFAREISRQVGRPVMNQTDLKGRYSFELTFTPENGPAGGPGGESGHGGGGPGGPGGGSGGGPAPSADGPSIFTALQEQLGLKLDSKKAPVQVFIIDKIEKPEEN